ncbi:MAG: T9SS type A sorting domain-containing protein [Saprospiraceae bacterium]
MIRNLLLLFIMLVSLGLSAQSSTNVPSNQVGSNYQYEQLVDDLKVFPNPTSDYFQITNSVNVKKIVVYNLFGKEVKSFYNYNNAQHEISDIKVGMYMVKMFDERNKVIKSVKLHKNFSGV